MKYSAIIEIPKGSDRRIHMSYDKSGFKDLGPIKDQIPVNGGVMPVDYGYLENVINPIEKDEADVIVFSEKKHDVGDKIEVEIIGMITREDGDHKLIAIDETVSFKSFLETPEQERNLILEYFGYKSKIVSIDNADVAKTYLQKC